MKTGKWINIGLIGAGRIGRLHAENLSRHIDGARLSAIADVCLETAEEIAQKFEVPMAVPDYRVLLENPAIDAVAICSATDTHSAIIEAAAEAGKDIFCEKPIDFSLQKIDLALAAVKKAGVKLQIGFNRRFDPNFQKVRQLVAAGKIGTPHLLRITSRDPAPPPLEYIKVSGGIFLDMTIHDFYMASFLMQQPVSEIYAAGSVLVDPAIGTAGDIDTAAITLRFEGGAIGVIDNSRQAVYGYDQRVEVFGSAGMVTIGNNSPDQHVLQQTRRASIPPFPIISFWNATANPTSPRCGSSSNACNKTHRPLSPGRRAACQWSWAWPPENPGRKTAPSI